MTIASAAPAAPTGEPPRPASRTLVLGAVVGPVLFTLAWLLLGFTSTGYTLFDHTFTDYSPISQPISGLGMGSTAVYMNTAFVVTGLILIAGVVAVFDTIGTAGRPALHRAATVLLAGTGVGQIVCGVFDLEAMMPHMLGFLLALGLPIVSFVVAGRFLRRVPGWRPFGTWLMALGSPLTLLLLVAFFATFQPTADGAEHGVAGFVQRAGAIQVHAWFVAMGWLAFHRGPQPAGPTTSGRHAEPVRPRAHNSHGPDAVV
jgi:hypothetical membrane protein